MIRHAHSLSASYLPVLDVRAPVNASSVFRRQHFNVLVSSWSAVADLDVHVDVNMSVVRITIPEAAHMRHRAHMQHRAHIPSRKC